MNPTVTLLAITQRRPVDFSLFNTKQLLKVAQHHRLTNIIAHHLREYTDTPAELMTTFTLMQKKNSHYALLQLTALIEINSLFQKNHIPFFVLKGLPLSQRLYNDMTTRLSMDVDLLIDNEQVLLADKLLQQAGYLPLAHGVLSRKHLQLLQKSHHDLMYCNKKYPFRLELHFQLSDSYSLAIPFSELWKSRKTVTLMQQKLFVLAPVEEWIYLCSHASTHAWMRLQWLQDIAQYYQSQLPADTKNFWLQTQKKARYYGVEKHCQLGLMLLHHYFPELNLPKQAMDNKNLVSLQKLTLQIIAHRQQHSTPKYSILLSLKHQLLMWKLTSHWHHRLNLILHRPRKKFWQTWTKTKLPLCLYCLCYPLFILYLPYKILLHGVLIRRN